MKKSRRPLVRVGRRRAASILSISLRRLEAEIAAGRIAVEMVRGREKIAIVELGRYVTNEKDGQKSLLK